MTESDNECGKEVSGSGYGDGPHLCLLFASRILGFVCVVRLENNKNDTL